MSYTPSTTDPLAGVGNSVANRNGQATAVEQSRAIAEVQAAVVVAQQCPRDVTVARSEMQQSCAVPFFAQKAFYRFPRGGQIITDASVYLAREVARCWGNVQHGVDEMRRDDEHGQSEMKAWAWDVQTNTRASLTFIVPHKRDKRGGPEALLDMRDIYENNANNGARRLREVIFNIIPPWFTEEAKELCSATIQRGDGKPLPERIEGAVAAFANLGVQLVRLEMKTGRSKDRWSVYDIAQLLTIHRSIERGEVSVEEEFPQQRVTVDEIVAAPKAAPKAPAPKTKAPAQVELDPERPFE